MPGHGAARLQPVDAAVGAASGRMAHQPRATWDLGARRNSETSPGLLHADAEWHLALGLRPATPATSGLVTQNRGLSDSEFQLQGQAESFESRNGLGQELHSTDLLTQS